MFEKVKALDFQLTTSKLTHLFKQYPNKNWNALKEVNEFISQQVVNEQIVVTRKEKYLLKRYLALLEHRKSLYTVLESKGIRDITPFTTRQEIGQKLAQTEEEMIFLREQGCSCGTFNKDYSLQLTLKDIYSQLVDLTLEVDPPPYSQTMM